MYERLYWWRFGLWDRFGHPLKDLEFRFNHPDYVQILRGDLVTTRGPRSGRLCAFLDAISSNWFHD